MKNIFCSRAIKLTCVIALTLASFPNYLEANAQTARTSIRYSAPKPPNPGAPRGRGRGGGSRGPCKQYASLAALVPETQGTQKFIWGQSASQNPKFWFYVPEKLTSKLPVEFVLQDEADNYIYKTKFTPQAPAGVVSVTVKPTVALQPGKSYNWTFSIYCDPDKPSSSVFVRGSVTQVALNATQKQQLQKLQAPIQRAAFYANNGMWHDALTTLGEQIQNSKRREPEVISAWTELLTQTNFSNLATAPIVPCCQNKD
ncbi:hypothetical protein NIES2101_10890 [Calothrix sp. HK-06]|nr:hypothetical protein NIES2101_10890 [Calothrix sp. HK-06]